MDFKLYVISAGTDSVKVGIAKDPGRRQKEMQTGNHRKLVIEAVYHIGSYKQAHYVEQGVHKILKQWKLHIKGEWFKYRMKDIYKAIRCVIKDTAPEFQIPDERDHLLPEGAAEHMRDILH